MIRQYDVFATPRRRRSKDAGLIVVLQSHFTELNTVVVAPLLEPDRVDAIEIVMVPVTLDASPLLLNVAELAAIARPLLRRSLGTVTDQHDAIRRAIDRLLNGF